MSQRKEQDKTPEKELNEMEASNLPDAEFKTLVIRMLNELKGRLEELGENFNKEVENIKENQSEMNEITKMKTTLQRINIRSGETEIE